MDSRESRNVIRNTTGSFDCSFDRGRSPEVFFFFSDLSIITFSKNIRFTDLKNEIKRRVTKFLL